jgi:O-antigen/teichoic acid export membrane protein
VTQEALVSLPYTFQQRRPAGTPAEYAGGALMQSCLMSAVITVVLAAIALWIFERGSELVVVAWVLAAVVPFALLREFGRRFAFAHLKSLEALILDVCVAAIQLLILGYLKWTGQLTPPLALLAIGVGCAVGGVGWLYLARWSFTIRVDQLLKSIRRNWSLGKVLLANRLACVLGAQSIPWLLAWICGVATAGLLAACLSVALLANPLLFGLNNITHARAVMAFAEGGGARLWKESLHNACLIGAAMALFCLVVSFVGQDLLHLFYDDPEYLGHGYVITLLALDIAVWGLGNPAESALAAIGHARAAMWATLLGTAISVVLAWFWVGDWGLQGAAYAGLVGSIVRSGVRWGKFWALIDRQGTSALNAHHQELLVQSRR